MSEGTFVRAGKRRALPRRFLLALLTLVASGTATAAVLGARPAGARAGAANVMEPVRYPGVEAERTKGGSAPRWGPCFEPNAPFFCADVCARNHGVCKAKGCDGATHAEYVDLRACGREIQRLVGSESCDTPLLLGDGQAVARCCCAKP